MLAARDTTISWYDVVAMRRPGAPAGRAGSLVAEVRHKSESIPTGLVYGSRWLPNRSDIPGWLVNPT